MAAIKHLLRQLNLFQIEAQLAGKAYKPAFNNNRNNKHLAFAVAGWGYYSYGNEYYSMLELFHLLGAGHSIHNTKASRKYSR
ncbi:MULTISPECIES: hypothetical protein [unclassified Pseudoalteromonas]|uniref:hypothetical protein n=1 Tax=unclassified Pseudoalteromonas TaxID=194690 RepID=UPI001F2F4EA8|nr:MULTISPECIES: hypothetical protein [unclassified Pseudoalteromonas]MCF2827452.1 hypothetical protein [Pseudoalteromonas sp. OF5H-5]MCF2830103.1 hypothetical protein [Pseudoalteromonas sp. DL2-H6]MCF2923497.1 hypothetical protein [Pseudoalteromonas sp. DL2-H1]